MNILDNELVKKYFGNDDPRTTAWLILRAMQEPISTGDKYLAWTIPVNSGQGYWVEASVTSNLNVGLGDWHPFALRPPDKFQKRKCGNRKPCSCPCRQMLCDCGNNCDQPQRDEVECDCGRAFFQGHSTICSISNPPKKDEVEEQIGHIMNNIPSTYNKIGWENELRELVRLVRDIK